mgnify:FL=1
MRVCAEMEFQLTEKNSFNFLDARLSGCGVATRKQYSPIFDVRMSGDGVPTNDHNIFHFLVRDEQSQCGRYHFSFSF